MAFLRFVKFLQIPEFSGATIRSILDTIINKSFISFIVIFIFVIISFALAFHLAFGVYIFELRDLENSFVTLLGFVFGNVTTDFVSQNRIFGPTLLIIYAIGSSFVLSNMFIAVISDIYVGVHKEHKDFWERHILSLLIKAVVKTERRTTTTGDLIGRIYTFIVKKTFVSEWVHAWRTWREKRRTERVLLAGLDLSDKDDDSSEDDVNSDEEAATNELELNEVDASSKHGSSIDIMETDSMASATSSKRYRKKQAIFYNPDQLDKLTFEFFLTKSSKENEVENQLRAEISTLKQDIQEIKQLLLNQLQKINYLIVMNQYCREFVQLKSDQHITNVLIYFSN